MTKAPILRVRPLFQGDYFARMVEAAENECVARLRSTLPRIDGGHEHGRDRPSGLHPSRPSAPGSKLHQPI